MPKPPPPLPQKLGVRDIIQILFSILMIPLGLIILYHTVTRIRTVTGYLVGIAFVAYGTYRLIQAYSRYRQMLHNRSKSPQ